MSPRTKNTPEDWKRTRFCAHTHTQKSKGTRTHCCFVVSSARVDRSISPGPSSLFGWLAVVSLDRYERDRHRDRFFSDRNSMHDAPQSFPLLFDRFKTRSRRRKRQTNSRRAREKTRKKHTERRRRRRRRRRRKETTTHPCIARLPISPIRPIRRRTFPKTPPRPRLVSLWMPTPTTPTPRPSSRTRSFSSSHNTCCFFCRRRP